MRRVVIGIAAAILSLAVAATTFAGTNGEKNKDVTDPEIVQRVPPVYPEAARAERVQGIVVLDLTIEADGRVSAVQVFQGVDPRLDKAAVDAVQQWTFKPARDKKNQPVKVAYKVTVRFLLDGKDKKD